jgi:hypothetical protein
MNRDPILAPWSVASRPHIAKLVGRGPRYLNLARTLQAFLLRRLRTFQQILDQNWQFANAYSGRMIYR